MTTSLTLVDNQHGGESRVEATARRLRGELAQRNLKPAAAARILGVTQPWISRRTTGTVEFGIGELDMICDRLGLSFEYIVTGIRALPESPLGPTGQPVDQSTLSEHAA